MQPHMPSQLTRILSLPAAAASFSSSGRKLMNEAVPCLGCSCQSSLSSALTLGLAQASFCNLKCALR